MKEKPAIGYLRVSTNGQVEGVSLDAQRERIESWAKAHGFELLDVHVDRAISGAKAHNRPGLQRAITAACQEKAALVTYSLSRLARSTRDAIDIAEQLDKAGADLVSLTEQIDTTSAAGRMIFRMLAVLAEFERDLISERTTTALAHIRKQGRKTGGVVPYGFRADRAGNLIEHKGEQRAIALMLALRKEGLSLRAIARELEARGIKTKTGAPWSAKVIMGILNRERAA